MSGNTVTVWEDDPASGTVTTAAKPDVAKQPFGYSFHTPEPPLSDEIDSPEFRYWTAAEALRRGADFWAPTVLTQHWQRGSILEVHLAVKAAAIPPSRKPPLQDDFPDAGEAAGRGIALLDGEVGTSGTAILIQNISYFGHSKFTEPVPSTALRGFRIDLPAKCNRRYLARILPKRFCFDQSGTVFAEKGELLRRRPVHLTEGIAL
jgi:hypothetical protein